MNFTIWVDPNRDLSSVHEKFDVLNGPDCRVKVIIFVSMEMIISFIRRVKLTSNLGTWSESKQDD